MSIEQQGECDRRSCQRGPKTPARPDRGATTPAHDSLGEAERLSHCAGLRRWITRQALAVAAGYIVLCPTVLGQETATDESPRPLAEGIVIQTQPASTEPAASAPTTQEAVQEPGELDALDVDEVSELEDIELYDLEIPVVVTASRRVQKITDVPYAISVITAEDIRRSGARSVPDALRLVPGVDVAEISYGMTAVSPRGLHGLRSNHILVLVDGRQIFDAVFGGTFWGAWPFQLEDIERIEIIRGPGGVTWGANAVNGVINIITKDPADQLGLTVTGGGGSRGTQKEHLGYALAEEKLRIRISAEYEGSDGFREGGSLLRQLDDNYKAGRIGIHAIYDAGPDDAVTLSAGSSVVDGLFPPAPVYGFNLQNPGTQANYLLSGWHHRISTDDSFQLTGYVNDFRADFGNSVTDYGYQQLALQFSHTFKPSTAHTLTWGIDGRADLVDATNADAFMLSKDFVSTGIIGLYVQDEWRFAPRWSLNLGGRIDYEFYGGFQPSCRAALSYELVENSLVYAAVSRAFHMPAAVRFADVPMLDPLVRIRANRDTAPTGLIAYEFGYRGRFLDRVEFNLNLYWDEYSDIYSLGPELGPPDLLQAVFDNRASASAYGVEFDAQYAVGKNLKLLANYTFEQIDWRSSSPLGYNLEADLVTPPKHKFMIGARYDLTNDLHLSGHLYYVDAVKAPNPANPFVPRSVDPYFRLDLLAEYEFWKDRASLAVGVRNLLDSHHYEGGTLFLNDAEVPRMVYAELRLTLK